MSVISAILLYYMCYADNIPDLENYKLHYEYLLYINSLEWLYLSLIELSKWLGLSFFQFRAVCYVSSLVILNTAIGKFVKNRFIIYMLYVVYPFFYDVIQTRNFMAMALISYGITFLVDKNYRHGNLLFFTTVLLAAGIQAISYLYLILLIVNYIPLHCKKNTLFAMIVLFTFGIVAPLQATILSKLIHIFEITDYRIINLTFASRYGIYLYALINAMHALLLLWALHLLSSEKFFHGTKQYDFVKFMALSLILLFFIVPLYYYTVLFYRVIRNLFPLSHVICYLVIKYKSFDFDKIMFIFSYVLFVLAIAVMQFYVPHYDVLWNILST